MDADLSSFEQKVEKVVAYCQTLRDENRSLHVRIADLEKEKLALAEKIDTTCVRLAALMDKLPEQ